MEYQLLGRLRMPVLHRLCGSTLRGNRCLFSKSVYQQWDMRRPFSGTRRKFISMSLPLWWVLLAKISHLFTKIRFRIQSRSTLFRHQIYETFIHFPQTPIKRLRNPAARRHIARVEIVYSALDDLVSPIFGSNIGHIYIKMFVLLNCRLCWQKLPIRNRSV